MKRSYQNCLASLFCAVTADSKSRWIARKACLWSEPLCSFFTGKAFTNWRGLALRKYPVDIVIVQQLLWELKPATVFEMGTHEGGSALWMSDMLRMFGCKSHVFTCDIDQETIKPLAKQDDGITFVHGDLMKVDELLPADMLEVCVPLHHTTHYQPTTNHTPHTTNHHDQLTTNLQTTHQLLTTNHSPATTHLLPLATSYSPPTTHKRPHYPTPLTR